MAANQKKDADNEEAVEPQVPDGVFVAKVRTDDGGIHTQIVLQGGIEPTEVQTLLELGVRGWREQIGLAG